MQEDVERCPWDSGRRGRVDLGRAIDLVLSVVGVVVLTLPALIIAVAVKLSSPGPVLYRQWRVGRGGVEFRMVKFRSMRVGTHEEILGDSAQRAAYEAAEFKLPEDDPRITSVGRWLRKYSLDEIPQLWNVVRGEMSLVGIRPVERAQLEQRSACDQTIYRSLRPGLTGLWQIEGRSTLHPRERVELDRLYASKKSVSGDIRIMLRTISVVVGGASDG